MASKAELQSAPGAAAIVAALLLPPLGVFLGRGIGAAFWIAVALTCVGFFPGMVFALLLMFRPDLLPAHPGR